MRFTAMETGLPERVAIAATILFSVLVLSGCGEEKRHASPPRAELGAATVVLAGTVPPGGGSLEVIDSQFLNGLRIEVPAGAFPDDVTIVVGRHDATGMDLGPLVEPRSELIEVDLGGAEAAVPLALRVPARVPDDHVPLGFYWNPETGTTEAIPVIGFDEESVTLLTRHFSSFLVSSIARTRLEGVIESRFEPGRDAWQIPNLGSCITPLGNCSGMSLSSLWYFCERREPPLHARYDNDEGDRKTPGFWQDDVGAIRLCSVVQAEIKPMLDRNIEKAVRDTKIEGRRLKGDALTFYSFAYAIATSHDPQYLSVHRAGGAVSHALLVHRVTPHALHVVDPNHPNRDDITIELEIPSSGLLDARLRPYEASLSSQPGSETRFDGFLFMGRSSLVDWQRIGRLFTDLEAGDVGSRHFPRYDLFVVAEGGGERLFGLDRLNPNVVSEAQLRIEAPRLAVRRVKAEEVGAFEEPAVPSRVSICRAEAPGSFVAGGTIDLAEGRNRLGFLVEARMPEGWRWAGFDWIDVVREKPAPAPADDPEREYVFAFTEADGAVFEGPAGKLLANGIGSCQVHSNLDRVGTLAEHRRTKTGSYPGNVSLDYRASAKPVDLGGGMKGGSAQIRIDKFATDALARKQFEWSYLSESKRAGYEKTRRAMWEAGFGGTIEVGEDEVLFWEPKPRPRDIGRGRPTSGDEILMTAINVVKLYRNCILVAAAGSEVTVPAGTNPARGQVPADPHALIAAARALIDRKRASDPGPEGFERK